MTHLDILKQKLNSRKLSLRTLQVNEYIFFVWDQIGDHHEKVYAESMKEAVSDLKDEIKSKSYYTGKVNYRLEKVIPGKVQKYYI